MVDDGIKIHTSGRNAIAPAKDDCAFVADRYRDGLPFTLRYFRIMRDLMLAGFCLLFAIAPALSEDVFKPTGRYVQPSKPQRQWYLVSEPWCTYCPAAKAKFLAKGWSEKNILTRAQCEARFGFVPDRVPFEFGEPVEAKETAVIKPVAMSHSEMVATHNRLHGGGQWTWPGDLATHLRTTHGVSTTASVPVKSQPVRVQQSVSCPTGGCPTNRVQRRRGGFLGGLFR